jgi:hypothetical protein
MGFKQAGVDHKSLVHHYKLLQEGRQTNVTKSSAATDEHRSPIAIGDTFQVLVYHQPFCFAL